MKNAVTYKAAFGCILAFLCCSLAAQNHTLPFSDNPTVQEVQKRTEHYMELKNLGYSEREIYEDLGNANFLTENYATALFWYDKLKALDADGILPRSYVKRYKHALKVWSGEQSNVTSADRDWLAMVKEDYGMDGDSYGSAQSVARNYRSLDPYLNGNEFSNREVVAQSTEKFDHIEKLTHGEAYEAPIALTADGKTAFFSNTVYMKPSHGIFSKKEAIHKIYRAHKVNGEWRNIEELKVCPKYSSALHPAVSQDGKRLFFASDMPGTLGKYDIYVSTINSNGTMGVAKNLGEKVNTKKNDLYPNIVGSNTLFFASEGREGHGGMDVYMVQVNRNKVGLAVNLGSPINSKEDDFSIQFKTKDGMGYVMSNRGKNKEAVRQVAFTYGNKKNNKPVDQREYNILEALNNGLRVDYSSSVFEDE